MAGVGVDDEALHLDQQGPDGGVLADERLEVNGPLVFYVLVELLVRKDKEISVSVYLLTLGLLI